jgi:hypothetical protein
MPAEKLSLERCRGHGAVPPTRWLKNLPSPAVPVIVTSSGQDGAAGHPGAEVQGQR